MSWLRTASPKIIRKAKYQKNEGSSNSLCKAVLSFVVDIKITSASLLTLDPGHLQSDAIGTCCAQTTMTGQRVTATYSAPLVFQSTDLWEQVRSAIVAQLPLRNLHWKSASRSSIRTVQELHIDLVPYETTGREDHASQVPGSILEKPLLNVYIVACEVCQYNVLVCC